MSFRTVLLSALAGVFVTGAAWAGSVQAIYSFKGRQGRTPQGALVAVKGALYGTAYVGGIKTGPCRFGCGTVYRVTPDGRFHVVHYFTGGSDGAYPDNTLIYSGGVFYGAMEGTNGLGAIFAMTPDGTVTVLHTFAGKDGEFPTGRLAIIGDTLYGVTNYAGALNAGTAYGLTTSGAYTVLHDFGASGDGQRPAGGLAVLQGRLYGTTGGGGASNYGTVFSLGTDGTETVLHSFSSEDPLGGFPWFSMITAGGRVYGITQAGGACQDCGTLFSVEPDGHVKLAYAFQESSGGYFPIGDLTERQGSVYGMTDAGGDDHYGTVYSYSPKAGFQALGSLPVNGIAGLDCNGATYDKGVLVGTCPEGGAYGRGTVFSVAP